MARPATDSDHRRHRSMAATRAIAAVMREIRALFAVPWDLWDEWWKACRSVVDARKTALVAACQDIAAMQAGRRHDPPPPDGHDRPCPPAAR